MKVPQEEKVIFLNSLLEAERAGVKVISSFTPSIQDSDLKSLLQSFLNDEGMNCQILINLIKRNQGIVSNKTGDFADKFNLMSNTREKLDFLTRGQEWVVRQIRRNYHLFDAGSEYLFMEAVKKQHEENVDSIKAFLSLLNNIKSG